jgi:hypothetical protein
VTENWVKKGLEFTSPFQFDAAKVTSGREVGAATDLALAVYRCPSLLGSAASNRHSEPHNR